MDGKEKEKEERNVPKLRFPGFTGEWEKRKLGELVKVCSGCDYKHLSKGSIPVYGTGGYMTSVNKALSYEQDAVGIGRKGTIDKPYLLKAPFWTVDTLFFAIPEASVDINFILGVFLKVDWKQRDESTGVPSLSKQTINSVDVFVPGYAEQVKIGEKLSELDTLIALYQQKAEHLQELKKGLLQKMFPKAGSKVPEMRFPGFTGEWEEKELSDLLERRRIMQRISDEAPRLAFAAGQGVIPLSERKTNNRDQLISDEGTKKYLVTEYDDIVYNPANLKYGAIDRNSYGRGVISPIYVTFTTKEIPTFIESLVTRERFKLKALQFEEGTVTKRQSVSPEDLLSLKEMISSSKVEQNRIGGFFTTFNKYIFLHQLKLDHLRELKKGLLQQMFV